VHHYFLFLSKYLFPYLFGCFDGTGIELTAPKPKALPTTTTTTTTTKCIISGNLKCVMQIGYSTRVCFKWRLYSFHRINIFALFYFCSANGTNFVDFQPFINALLVESVQTTRKSL